MRLSEITDFWYAGWGRWLIVLLIVVNAYLSVRVLQQGNYVVFVLGVLVCLMASVELYKNIQARRNEEYLQTLNESTPANTAPSYNSSDTEDNTEDAQEQESEEVKK